MIQNDAARIVTGLTRSVSLVKLYNEIGWPSLSNRRKFQKLVIIYKIKHNLAPDYLSDLFPNTVGNITHYFLRNIDDFSILNRRTAIFSNSFVPSAISLWNDLPESLRNLDTVDKFKLALKKVLYPENHDSPKFLFLGERKLTIIHARLRNNCSDLQSDLFRNHLSEDEKCRCGFIRENADHFFFLCPLYENERLQLFRSTQKFNPIRLQKLLYRCETLSDKENAELINAVHKYI